MGRNLCVVVQCMMEPVTLDKTRYRQPRADGIAAVCELPTQDVLLSNTVSIAFNPALTQNKADQQFFEGWWLFCGNPLVFTWLRTFLVHLSQLPDPSPYCNTGCARTNSHSYCTVAALTSPISICAIVFVFYPQPCQDPSVHRPVPNTKFHMVCTESMDDQPQDTAEGHRLSSSSRPFLRVTCMPSTSALLQPTVPYQHQVSLVVRVQYSTVLAL